MSIREGSQPWRGAGACGVRAAWRWASLGTGPPTIPRRSRLRTEPPPGALVPDSPSRCAPPWVARPAAEQPSTLGEPLFVRLVGLVLGCGSPQTQAPAPSPPAPPAPVELVALGAASLTDVLPKVAEAWKAQGGTIVTFSFDSSSKLAR